MIDHLDHEGSVRRWFNNNFSNTEKEENDDGLADFFSLSKNDIAKFTPKKKKRKVNENSVDK